MVAASENNIFDLVDSVQILGPPKNKLGSSSLAFIGSKYVYFLLLFNFCPRCGGT